MLMKHFEAGVGQGNPGWARDAIVRGLQGVYGVKDRRELVAKLQDDDKTNDPAWWSDNFKDPRMKQFFIKIVMENEDAIGAKMAAEGFDPSEQYDVGMSAQLRAKADADAARFAQRREGITRGAAEKQKKGEEEYVGKAKSAVDELVGAYDEGIEGLKE